MPSRKRNYARSRNGIRFESLEERRLLAFQPELVADINSFALSSNPSSYVTSGQSAYFFAKDAEHGRELWRTDGTSQGTTFVKELTPGTADTAVAELFDLNGRLIILAGPARDYSRSLWSSDGTSAGTVQIASNLPVPFGKTQTAVMEGSLYFAMPHHRGLSLWRTDGSIGGTWMVHDFTNAPEGNVPFENVHLTAIGNRLFFFANDRTTGAEMWTSDGNSLGTHMVKEIRPGGEGVISWYYGESIKHAIAEENGFAMFLADDGVHGLQLWRSDGTQAGTVAIKDLGLTAGNAAPKMVKTINGRLFFSAVGGIWRATTRGYEKFSNLTTQEMVLNHGTLYFPASTELYGLELMKSKGVPGDEQIVANITEGSFGSFLEDLVSVGDWIYFRDNQHELWRTDGTEAQTTKVFDLVSQLRLGGEYCNPGATTMVVNGEKVALLTGQSAAGGCEPWIAPGKATESPRLLRDVFASTEGSGAHTWGEVNGILYFTAEDENLDYDLWTVSRAHGVSRLRDTSPGDVPYYSPFVGNDEFEPLNGKLVFAARTPQYGDELWITDGSAGGTQLIKDVLPGPGGSSPEIIARVGKVLYFRTVLPEANYNHLWKTDGTAAGTVLVTDRWPGQFQFPQSGHGPQLFVAMANDLYFVGWDAEHGSELWRSNGTNAGTVRITDIAPGAMSSIEYPSLTYPVANGDQLYFFAKDANGVTSLWRTRGLLETTSAVALNVAPSLPNRGPTMLAARENIFFRGKSAQYGDEIWVSGAAGTRVARDIFPGAQTSDPQFLTDVSGTAFFVADDGAHGRELWASDGTAAGTRLVRDIAEGDSAPQELYNVNGILFFTADDGVHGRELWRSDGTAEGTYMIADHNPGKLSSDPRGPVFSNGSLYFTADNGRTGMELFRLTRIPGDMDFNGYVDLDDLNVVRDWFGAEGEGLAGDMDRNGYVDLVDLNIVRDWFGAAVPLVAPAPPPFAKAPPFKSSPMPAQSVSQDRANLNDALFGIKPLSSLSALSNSTSLNKRPARRWTT